MTREKWHYAEPMIFCAQLTRITTIINIIICKGTKKNHKRKGNTKLFIKKIIYLCLCFEQLEQALSCCEEKNVKVLALADFKTGVGVGL